MKDKVGEGIGITAESENKEVVERTVVTILDDNVEEAVDVGASGQVNPGKVDSPTVKEGKCVKHQTYKTTFLVQLPILNIAQAGIPDEALRSPEFTHERVR